MNKKIGIITFTDTYNFGNRLQNYATQEILRECGFEVSTIRTQKQTFFLKIKNVIKNITVLIAKLFGIKTNIKINIYNRQKIFREWDQNFVKQEKISIYDSDINKKQELFDGFVCGSDQVWNPYFINTTAFFLDFADRDKRVAFCASIGIEKLPEDKVDLYHEKLNEMKAISVREYAGKRIVNELTDDKYDVEVFLDPTLMLGKERWQKIAETSDKKMTHSYILLYFLGDVSPHMKSIQQMADFCDLEIYNVLVEEDMDKMAHSPSDFVRLISDAALVITDSFHGTAFSIIFEKPFYVVHRDVEDSMDSRLDTVLDRFGLMNRKVLLLGGLQENQWNNIDYDNNLVIMDDEKKRAMAYLIQNL